MSHRLKSWLYVTGRHWWMGLALIDIWYKTMARILPLLAPLLMHVREGILGTKAKKRKEKNLEGKVLERYAFLWTLLATNNWYNYCTNHISFPQICNLKNSWKSVTQVNKLKILRVMYIPPHSGTHFSQLEANTEIWVLPWATLRVQWQFGQLTGTSYLKSVSTTDGQLTPTLPKSKQVSK